MKSKSKCIEHNYHINCPKWLNATWDNAFLAFGESGLYRTHVRRRARSHQICTLFRSSLRVCQKVFRHADPPDGFSPSGDFYMQQRQRAAEGVKTRLTAFCQKIHFIFCGAVLKNGKKGKQIDFLSGKSTEIRMS